MTLEYALTNNVELPTIDEVIEFDVVFEFKDDYTLQSLIEILAEYNYYRPSSSLNKPGQQLMKMDKHFMIRHILQNSTFVLLNTQELVWSTSSYERLSYDSMLTCDKSLKEMGIDITAQEVYVSYVSELGLTK